jgi:prenylcysteine oxidase/farnesylcysteine lyase
VPINITIFEKVSRIGGRTTTVNALDDERYPTELGASIFVQVNRILYDAANEFNLTTIDPLEIRHVESDYSLGVWDGESFVFRQAASNGGFPWWDIAKLLWRYGLAPIRTQSLTKSTIGRFLRMYDEPIFPFQSLDAAAARVGLVDFTAATGTQILRQGGIGEKFSREIIQASTRVNYGQNLGGIHGLETMVCMVADHAMAVQGGNWQIFDAMVKASRADVRLNSTVQRISKQENGAYIITTAAQHNGKADDLVDQEFDTVILATPYQFSEISFTPPLTNPPDEIPYVTLHVTLFTSPHRLSPSFFNFDLSTSAKEVPDMVLTTLPEGLDLGARKGKDGVGPAGFWSVSLHRSIELEDGTTQYLYKIFSPEQLTATWMARLLGLTDDLSTPMDDEAENKTSDPISRLSKQDVSWSYEKVWHSYPYELPRITFERIRLEGRASDPRGIWYTSGIETFISAMETSALMGKNVARLIVDNSNARHTATCDSHAIF